MQTSTSLKRLLAAVMAVVMMLTAIPFVTAADETAAAKDTIAFGKYVWEILEKEEDGDLVLITKDVVEKIAFYTTAPTSANPINYSTGKIPGYLNDGDASFYATAFTAEEKAAITASTLTYIYYDVTAKAKATGTLTANVIIPNEAMATKYSLGVANLDGAATQYWLADAVASTAAAKAVRTISVAGKLANLNASTNKITAGLRPMITLKAGNYAQFPAVDGVSYTVNDNAVTYYATTSATSFKVVVDAENYAADELAVALGGETLVATDGVYTIAAGNTAELTVSGIKAQPADFTAYNEAVAKAGEVDRDLCDTTDLDAALAVDVSACTKLEQAKVDEAAAAILDAIANLKYKPADTAKYLEVLEQLRTILANEPVQITETVKKPLYNLDATANEIGDNFKAVIYEVLDKYEDRTDAPVSEYTIDKQDDVDAAAAEIEELIAKVPVVKADRGPWKDAYKACIEINVDLYSNAAEIKAAAEEIAAEANYNDGFLNPDITEQKAIDDAAAKLVALFETRQLIPADFTALDAALEAAATYLRDNYYYEDEMAGSDAAWAEFAAALEAASSLDRESYNTIRQQSTIDDRTAALERTMSLLEPFTRLTPWQEFWKPVKDFFQEVADFFGMVGGLLKTIFDLIPLLISGEIVLYDVFVLIGDEDLLAFVEKIGIKPAPEPEPEA